MNLLYHDVYGHGPDLILLHGLFGSHENLKNLGKKLSSTYRVHALDLRNHGQSFHAKSMSYTDMATDILNYLNDKNFPEVHITGHSMGGKVAMQTALSYPEYISSLCVLDMAPIDYKEYNAGSRHDNILQGLKHIANAEITQRSQANIILTSYVKEPEIRAFLLKNLRKSNNGQLTLRLNIDAITNSYACISGALQGTSYQGPTLFLKGEHSDYLLPAYKAETLSLFPHAQLKVISNTSHWLHAEKPEAVYMTIKKFLEIVRG